MSPSGGFVERLAELVATGNPVASVTVVASVGSTPADVGAKLLVDGSGLAYGTVGGGRVEARAIAYAQELLTNPKSATVVLVEWNLQRDVGMTCGGVVQLLFETYNVRPWRVVIFGAGHVAQALVRCLLLVECRVVCVDARDEWLVRLPSSKSLQVLRLDEPCDFVAQLQDDDHVVCMTMGHRTDRPILERILRRPKPLAYLGVIGSAAKRQVLVRELVAAGIDAEVARGFRCPAGLKLGSNHPGEIAVSMAAELLQVRDAQRSAP